MDRNLDTVLRTTKPEPRAGFVEGLEARLVGEFATARRRANALRASAGLTLGLAMTLLVLGVSGMLPLNLGAADPGEARQDCRMVVVERMERVPTLVVAKTGGLRVRYRVTPVRRSVRRCRAPAGR